MSRKRALIGNAGDEEQQAKAKETQKSEELRKASDDAAVGSTVQGRRWIWENLIVASRIFEKDMGPTETLQHLFGMQYPTKRVLNRLLQDNPQIVMQMIAENCGK